MSVSIRKIVDSGSISTERVVMEVKDDQDIGDFILIRAKISKAKDSVLAGSVIAYWFPDKKVKSGDLVVLYSKNGNNGRKVHDDGTTSYFFYWENNNAVWHAEYRPVLIEKYTWERLRLDGDS